MIDKPPVSRFVFTAPDGATFKRSLRAPRLWCLVAKPSYEWALADAQKDTNFRLRYRELVGPEYAYHPHYAASILEGAASEDEYAARGVRDRLARIKEARLRGYYDRYSPLKYLRTPEVPPLSKYDRSYYTDHTVIEGVASAIPLPRSEQRLNAALAGNPYSGGISRVAWAAGVRHGFAMAYKPGKTVNGVYKVPTDV